MRSEPNQATSFHANLKYFAETPNILHLRYVLARYPHVSMTLFYKEIMANFDRLVMDASELAYFMANFPNHAGEISLRLCNRAVFTRLISCDPTNLLLIARQRPSIASELLIYFRKIFSSTYVSSQVADEISQLDLQVQLISRHQPGMFFLQLPRHLSFFESLSEAQRRGVPTTRST